MRSDSAIVALEAIRKEFGCRHADFATQLNSCAAARRRTILDLEFDLRFNKGFQEPVQRWGEILGNHCMSIRPALKANPTAFRAVLAKCISDAYECRTLYNLIRFVWAKDEKTYAPYRKLRRCLDEAVIPIFVDPQKTWSAALAAKGVATPRAASDQPVTESFENIASSGSMAHAEAEVRDDLIFHLVPLTDVELSYNCIWNALLAQHTYEQLDTQTRIALAFEHDQILMQIGLDGEKHPGAAWCFMPSAFEQRHIKPTGASWRRMDGLQRIVDTCERPSEDIARKVLVQLRACGLLIDPTKPVRRILE